MGYIVNKMDEIGSDYSLFEGSFIYMRDLEYDIADKGAAQNNIDENALARLNVWIINEEEMGAIMIPKIIKPEEL